MRQRPSNVRLAEPADEEAVYRLLLLLEHDNGIGFPHNEEAVRRHIRLGTERRGGVLGVVDAPDGGRLAGSVSVEWGEFWYGGHYLAELWLFVDPPYRKGTGYADDLMNWTRWIHEQYEVAAKAKIPLFSSVTSRKRLPAKMRWWARRGELIGAIYLLG